MNPSEPPIDCARTGAATKIDAWPANPTVVMIAVRRSPGRPTIAPSPAARSCRSVAGCSPCSRSVSGTVRSSPTQPTSRTTGTHSGAVAESATRAVASGGATTAATL